MSISEPAPDIVERVRQLVADETGAHRDEITLDTRLSDDLGVAGDDGCELMEAFAREFQVDMTGVDLFGHFGHEGWGVPGCAYATMGLVPVVVLVMSRVESPWVLVPSLVAPVAFACWFAGRVFGRGAWHSGGDVPITVRDLAEAAQRKAWRRAGAPP